MIELHDRLVNAKSLDERDSQYYISRDDEMNNTQLESTTAIASALSHPARLRAVAMLRTGELCACQITEVLGLASSTVSAHLKELKRAGLLVERKEGRWVYFGLSNQPAAQSWVTTALLSVGDDPQLLADEEMVAEMRTLSVEDLCRLGFQEARKRAATTTELSR